MLVTLIIFTQHLREYESTRTRTWCRWQWRQRKRHGRPCRGLLQSLGSGEVNTTSGVVGGSVASDEVENKSGEHGDVA